MLLQKTSIRRWRQIRGRDLHPAVYVPGGRPPEVHLSLRELQDQFPGVRLRPTLDDGDSPLRWPQWTLQMSQASLYPAAAGVDR